jgi:hypothetical protein
MLAEIACGQIAAKQGETSMLSLTFKEPDMQKRKLGKIFLKVPAILQSKVATRFLIRAHL